MTATTREFDTRILVTHPGGRHSVTTDPWDVAAALYDTTAGYSLARVRGYDADDGSGFVIVHNHSGQRKG